MRRSLVTAVLLAALLAAPAGAHGLISLGLVVPATCPDGEACLTTREAQPKLHAGETVDVNAYNDDEQRHRLHVADNASLDPTRANTSTEHALVSSEPIEPGGSQALGELTIPDGAEALYVWCSVDDHEAAGEHLLVPVEPSHDGEETDAVPGFGPSVAALAAILALAVGRRRIP